MDLRVIVDAALEVSVVGSFSRIGPAFGDACSDWANRRPWLWSAGRRSSPARRRGSGATARGLAALGARVVLLGRNEGRLAARTRRAAQLAGEDRFPIVVADMASLASVRRGVEQIHATETRLDILVDNAGAIYPERTLSPDEIEATLAVLVVALSCSSAACSRCSRLRRARVIAVTAGGMYTQAVEPRRPEWERRVLRFARLRARKRIQVALVREWARRLARAGRRQRDASGLGRHARAGELAPRLPSAHATAAADAERRVDTILWLATTEAPCVRAAGSTWTAACVRSTACRAPG